MPAEPHVDERRLLGTIPLLAIPNVTGAVLVFLFQKVLVPDEGSTGLGLRRAFLTFLAYLGVSTGEVVAGHSPRTGGTSPASSCAVGRARPTRSRPHNLPA